MQPTRLFGFGTAVLWFGLILLSARAAAVKPAPPPAVPPPVAPSPAAPPPAPSSPLPATLAATKPSLHWAGDADHLTIPLIRAGDLLLAPVRINGHDAGPFLIDTAFATTTFDREATKVMGLPVIGSAPMRLGEQPTGDYVDVGELSVGPAAGSTPAAPLYASAGRTVALAADLGPLMSQYGLKVRGIIGNDLLKAVPITIDTRAATLTFYDPAHFASAFPPAASPTTAPGGGTFEGKLHVQVSGAFPSITGKIRGHDGWFLLQTAAPGGLTLYGPFLSLNRDIPEGYHPIPGAGALFGGDPLVQAADAGPFEGVDLLGRPASKMFAAFSLPGRPASVGFEVTSAGSIGATMLRDTRITMDYAAGKYWLTPLPAETPDQMIARLGDPAGRDLIGEGALMRAVGEGRADVVKILLDRNADPNAGTSFDVTPLMLAARTGREDIAVLLLAKGAKPDTTAAVGATTALLDASCVGQAGIVKALLAGKADPKLGDLQGYTPLHRAAQAGSLASVQALLADGADANARNKEKVSVLMASAIDGDVQVMGALLKGGADPNLSGPNGWTPLILAAATGAPLETMTTLLDGGAKPNFPDDGGRTALMMAAQRGDERATTLLLARGADPNAKSVTGRTARDFAADAPQTDALRVLSTTR